MPKINHRSKHLCGRVGIVIALLLGQAHLASAFEPNFARFVSGHDVLRLLAQAYPNTDRYSQTETCRRLGDAAQILGVSQPASGTPISNTPGPAFLNWYKNCLKSFAHSDVENTLKNGVLASLLSSPRPFSPNEGESPAQPNRPGIESLRTRYIPLSLKAASNVPNLYTYAAYVDQIKSTAWKQLPADFRTGLLKHWTLTWVGPEIIRDEAELIRTLDARLLQANPNVMDAAKKVTITLMLREEALTY